MHALSVLSCLACLFVPVLPVLHINRCHQWTGVVCTQARTICTMPATEKFVCMCLVWRLLFRDRHLHISGGYASRGGTGGGPSNGTEVMRLAAVLTQQALPMHYKVTSDGDKTQQH